MYSTYHTHIYVCVKYVQYIQHTHMTNLGATNDSGEGALGHVNSAAEIVELLPEEVVV